MKKTGWIMAVAVGILLSTMVFAQGTPYASGDKLNGQFWSESESDVLIFDDDFSTDLSGWDVLPDDCNGSWTIKDGQLSGYYTIRCGSAYKNHKDILLKDIYQPQTSDWRMEVDFTFLQHPYGDNDGPYYCSFVDFLLYQEANNKESYRVGYADFYWNGDPRDSINWNASKYYPWTEIDSGTANLSWDPKASNHAVFEKIGDTFTLYVNGTAVHNFTGTSLDGSVKLGFSVYGSVLLDNFKLYEHNGTSCTLTCTASGPSTGTVGNSVSFTSTATPSNCTGNVSYAWDFGDNQTSASQNPNHIYSAAGTYIWSMIASVDGIKCSRTGSITIPSIQTTGVFFDDFVDTLDWTGVYGKKAWPAKNTANNMSINSSSTPTYLRLTYDKSQGDNSTLLRTDQRFFYGTYAALVRFDNTLIQDPDYTDTNIQAFWTNGASDDPTNFFTECDFEYLPYNTWDKVTTDSTMWTTSWRNYLTKDKKYLPLVRENLVGEDRWFMLLMTFSKSSLQYQVLEKSGDSWIPKGTSCFAPPSEYYPRSTMRILLSNWIQLAKNLSLTEYKVNFDVDWVLYEKDETLTAEQVTEKVAQLQPLKHVDNAGIFMVAPTVLTGAPGDSGCVDLSWNYSGTGIDGYLVEWKQEGVETWTADIEQIYATKSATISGLSPGVSYNFRVRAVDTIDWKVVSEYSNTATVTSGSGNIQLSYSDSFSDTTLSSVWQPQEGDWKIVAGMNEGGSPEQDGKLFGWYDVGYGGTLDPQGDLLIDDAHQPTTADWDMEMDFYYIQDPYSTYYSACANICLWNNETDKETFYLGYAGDQWDGSSRGDITYDHQTYKPWTGIAHGSYNIQWSPKNGNHAKFEKRGNIIKAYLNGTLVHQFTSTLAGRLQETGTYPKVGLHVYGSILIDNVAVYEVNGGTTCSLSCSASAPSSGTAGNAVSFSASATPSNCTGAVSYSWDFGDGTTSAEQNPAHTYAAEGNYSWSMTASVEGVQCKKTGSIQVAAPVAPPIVSSMKKLGDPFRIAVFGSNLQSSIDVYINGSRWSEFKWKNSGKIVLKGGRSLKTAVPKNTSTEFRFVNRDGGETTITWSWP